MSAYFAASGNVTLGPRPATMILTRGRRTPRGALSRSLTCAYLPSNENGGSSWLSARVTISKCSPRIASRSPSDG